MTSKKLIEKQVKGEKISSPSTEEYKKKQEEINERIKAIVKHYERSAEEAAKHYVRF
ncbi:MAG: hypothetical protein U5L07_04905 [Desulfobacterales bacterium]|nr:hypothetical protein [Desulfobacterales bacterium]